jgi:cell division protein ZapA
MSNVTLVIAERKFTIACAEGEEQHIQKLGQIVDSKIHDMPGLAGQSEARSLLYAALLLADENFELKEAGGAPAEPQPDVAEPLEALAEGLEGIADRLEAMAGRN